MFSLTRHQRSKGDWILGQRQKRWSSRILAPSRPRACISGGKSGTMLLGIRRRETNEVYSAKPLKEGSLLITWAHENRSGRNLVDRRTARRSSPRPILLRGKSPFRMIESLFSYRCASTQLRFDQVLPLSCGFDNLEVCEESCQEECAAGLSALAAPFGAQ
jgi:hypothetical protein